MRNKTQFHEEIKIRDFLLSSKGLIEFRYCLKKSFGVESQRVLYLNTEKILISFPDSKGSMSNYDIECVVSLSFTDIPGCILVNLRDYTGRILKEKKWYFRSPEDASLFHRLVTAMTTHSRKWFDLFNGISFKKEVGMTKSDLDNAIETLCTNKEDFNEGSAALMIDECRIDKYQKSGVTFGDIVALLVTSEEVEVNTTEELLTRWLVIAEERMESLFSFRDSLVLDDADGVFDLSLTEDYLFHNVDQESEVPILTVPGRRFSCRLDQKTVESAGVNSLSPNLSPSTMKIDGSTPKKTDINPTSPKPSDPTKMSTVTILSVEIPQSSLIPTTYGSSDSASASVPVVVGKPVDTRRFSRKISRPRGSTCATRSLLPDLLDGEIVLTSLHNVNFTVGPPEGDRAGFLRSSGAISLTSYRIILFENNQRVGSSNPMQRGGPPLPTQISLPLQSISRVEMDQTKSSYELVVVAKDLRVVRMQFAGNSVNTFPSFFRSVLNSYAFPPKIQDIFAFRSPIIRMAVSTKDSLANLAVLSALQSDPFDETITTSESIEEFNGDASPITPSSSSVASPTTKVPKWPPPPKTVVGPPKSGVVNNPVGKPPHRKINEETKFLNDELSKAESMDNISNFTNGWKVFNPIAEFSRQGLFTDEKSSRTPFQTISGSLRALEESVSVGSRNAVSPARRRPSVLGGVAPGSNTSRWRLWQDDYSMVETYPSGFIVPSALTDREVQEAARYRSRQRLPALTWREPRSGACLVRSSQPMSGFSSQSNIEDKLLLNLYRMRGNAHDPREQKDPAGFYVIDCRSQLAATANAALGKGVENWKALVNTRVIFCGIGNIHVMRASLESLHKVLVPWLPPKSSNTGTSLAAEGMKIQRQIITQVRQVFGGPEEEPAATIGEENGGSPKNANAFRKRDWGLEGSQVEDARFFLSRVEESGWLEHLRIVMAGSMLVAEKLFFEGCGVLVHCSDGWDRTAQVCATAQLLLDPYFRTMEGFAVLIEKDWCGFGHKFHDRVGHTRSAYSDEATEISPIFLQWLDLVHQLLYQFPNKFEFNENLLVFIADSVHSCLFGNFLGNSEKERKVVLQVEEKTNSIWTYVLNEPNKKKFMNALYRGRSAVELLAESTYKASLTSHPYNNSESSNRNNSVDNGDGDGLFQSDPLWPNPRKVKLWERYFCRWDMEMHPRMCTGETWKDDWV